MGEKGGRRGVTGSTAKPISWHEGALSALEEELKELWNSCRFQREHVLNLQPLKLDMLIVKSGGVTETDNEIGKIFRTHNIVEYKSEDGTLDINTLMKTVAYACLYKCYETSQDPRPLDEITITVIRDSKPMGLFEYLESHGFCLRESFGGIYHLDGVAPFPMQIVVGRELDQEKHKWLRMASSRTTAQDIKEAIRYRGSVADKRERDLIDAIMELSARLNQEAFESVIRSEDMLEVLKNYSKPELDEAENKLLEKDRKIEQYKKKEEQHKKKEEQYKKENEQLKKSEEQYKKENEQYKKENEQLKKNEEQLKKNEEDSIRCIVEQMRHNHTGKDDIKSLIVAAFKLSEDEALSFLV